MGYNSNSLREGVSQNQNPARVFIIAGFLGSGKTTLLKRLLEQAIGNGQHPYVIMSEFGDIDIDGVLVADHRIELTSIVGGCACCDLRDELASSLRKIVRREKGATVFIESTGIADPAGIMLAIEPIIKSGAALIANIIVVYDACRNPLQGQDSGLIKDQLITADTILINKADLVPSLKTGEIQASIAQLNRQAELVITSQSAVDAATLLKKQSAVNIPPSAGKTSTRFRSFGFHVDTPLSRQGLERWLKTLPASVVRVKGFVRLTGYSGFYEVQSVFGQSSITAFDQFIEPPELLVLITHPMRTDGLVRRLQKCVIQAEKQVTQTNQN